jgi:Protein of unknown function (DUF1153)
MSRMSSVNAAHRLEPEQEPIFRANLPDSAVTRWVPRRKAELISAIENGILSAEDASKRYRLTPEELAEWQSSYSQFGARGLKATLVQQIRHVRRV